MWDKGEVELQTLCTYEQFIHSKVTVNGSEQVFMLTVVYGKPIMSQGEQLWCKLNDISKSIEEKWVMMGDFNAYMNPEEKRGANPNWCHTSRFYEWFEGVIWWTWDLWDHVLRGCGTTCVV